MFEPDELFSRPNALAAHYTRFRVDERLLLTGHSHQAWPDRGFEGQRRAWLDAAEYVDEKWERAFAVADRVRSGYARLLEDEDGYIALASSTHDLVIRFLSGLALKRRPRIVTTTGEFHTLRRQLDRLGEEGVEIIKVGDSPVDSVAQRLAETVDDRTAAVMVSSVFYHNGHVVRGLGDVLQVCRHHGAELLVDAYHALNVLPFSLKHERLEGAFVVGGGYKYCQLGEGNCFLRFPKDCRMRPLITGWFSEFEALSASGDELAYGHGPARFAGATYDPTSHYRATEVFDFFEQHHLTAEFLHRVSQHQVGLLARTFDELDADPRLIARDRSVSLEDIGGFLALESPRAGEICLTLRERGVSTDYRGELLRLGPAPYLCDEQLTASMEILARVIASFERVQ